MTTDDLIYGIHAVTALLNTHPENIIELYFQQDRQDQKIQQIMQMVKNLRIKYRELPRKKLDELVNAQHQGIIAHCRKAKLYNETDIEILLKGLESPPFLLILDEVQDPHNLGACLRSANAAGVHMVIAPKDNSVGLTPAVRKVASGAADVTPFIQVTNLARTLRSLKEQGIWLYGTAGEATSSLYNQNLTGPLGIVLGAEGKGLRRLTAELCDYLISIPMFGSVESLNVSVATGICLFEAVRQRNPDKF